MADDLAETSRLWLQVQCCGDADGRKLADWRGSAEIEQIDPELMTIYRKLCDWTRACAHARTGDRVAIASYLGNGAKFDRAIPEFSSACADQNERDYQQVVDAVNSGCVVARSGR
jgi:hypothetical protein